MQLKPELEGDLKESCKVANETYFFLFPSASEWNLGLHIAK